MGRLYYAAEIADNLSMTAFKKVRRGAPLKLTPEVQAEICNALRAGAYMETAAALAGVHKDSLYEWLKLAKKQKRGVFREFSDAVALAMAQAEMRDLLNIDKAAMGVEAEFETYPDGTMIHDAFGNPMDVSGKIVTTERGRPVMRRAGRDPDWAASAWRLERKYPKKWAKTEKTMELEGHDEESGGSIIVNFVAPDKKPK